MLLLQTAYRHMRCPTSCPVLTECAGASPLQVLRRCATRPEQQHVPGIPHLGRPDGGHVEPEVHHDLRLDSTCVCRHLCRFAQRHPGGCVPQILGNLASRRSKGVPTGLHSCIRHDVGDADNETPRIPHFGRSNGSHVKREVQQYLRFDACASMRMDMYLSDGDAVARSPGGGRAAALRR